MISFMQGRLGEYYITGDVAVTICCGLSLILCMFELTGGVADAIRNQWPQ